MHKNIYSIKDIASSTYNALQCFKSHAEASRIFEQTAQDEKTLINKYPQDFILVKLGEFDDETGLIKQVKEEIICRGVEYVSVQVQQD